MKIPSPINVDQVIEIFNTKIQEWEDSNDEEKVWNAYILYSKYKISIEDMKTNLDFLNEKDPNELYEFYLKLLEL